jgi:hypothetical protein
MASKVKRDNVPVEDFLLFPIVTTGTQALTLVDRTATFTRECQPLGCTKPLFTVEAIGPLAWAW